MPPLYSLTLLPRAIREFNELYNWYELQLDGLGDRFAATIKRKLDNIISNPELYGKKKGNFHEVLISRPFPCQVVYRIYKSKKEILVNSIFHTSRNPAKKYRTR